MNQLRITALLMTLGAAPMACNQDVETHDSELSWGHLQDQGLNPYAPQYLINKKPGEVYKVCVARYMVNELPGLEAEIEASINVWGAYLGRTIEVDTHVRDLPRASATDTNQTLKTRYYEICGADFDVVVGYAPLRGSTVGQTGSTWRGYSAQNITSFQRYLFLRDYKASPDTWGNNRWVSVQQLKQRSFDSHALITQMKARNSMEVSPTGASITLPVLVHEFGHVWGLCDQYEGPSNCDPNYKSAHPNLESMMAAASNLAKLYLTDDDITGIRALARRPGFNSSWPGTEDDLARPATPITRKEVDYLKLKSIEKVGLQYTIHFGVITTKGGELRFEYRLKGTDTWQKSPGYFPSDDPFMIPEYSYKQTMREEGDYEFRLNLRLKGADGKFGYPIYALP